jgi:tetraacyldisaccharide 4'-kinase
LSDDGLQHYALQRDIEVIVKRRRALGNRWCLPAGPLREPMSRLAQCDLLLDRDSDDVRERLGSCWELAEPGRRVRLDHFAGTRVYAMAGIGFPGLFFEGLRAAEIDIVAMPFADHHDYVDGDLPADDGIPLLVTHKDAVKLRRFARPGTWVVNLELELSDALQYRFLQLVESVSNG